MKIRWKQILAGVLTFMMIISVIPLTVSATETERTITTYEELKQFAEEVNRGNTFEGTTVILAANIALGGESNPWTAIGTASAPFKGTFDGGYHVISELSVSSGSCVGFFGNVNGGTVKNLVIRGSVSGSSEVGGIVGSLTNGKVINCGNEADVSGGRGVGGVVGSVNNDCIISGCYNTGTVRATTGYIGGVTGEHWKTGTLENCYNVGAVSGPATVGGVAGGHQAANPVLTNCYNAGKVTISEGGSGTRVGAVLGGNRGGTNTNCYYLAGTGSNEKDGITEVSAIEASKLGDAFQTGEDGVCTAVLVWESLICKDAPVRPAFIERTALSAQLAGYIKEAINSKKTKAGVGNGSLLGSKAYLSGASSTDTDWMALAMGRFGYFDAEGYHYLADDGTGYADYLAAMKAYIEKTYQENNGILHRVKATEWHRAVVAIAALGGDPTAFGVYKGSAIDLIADGSYNSPLQSGPGTQGINGWIWGLIAMDTGMYNVPAEAKYSRDTFIKEILKMQLTDGVNGNEYGGFVLGGFGSKSDVDITAMAIQALAPYYTDDTVYTYINENSKKEVTKTVRQCVDEALDCLGLMQNANGGFSSWNTENAESIAQVIVALCSVGMDPAKDERFIKNGKTLLDAMLRFRLSDGGFCHVLGDGGNSMATDQATYALVSYWRYENEMRSLYDMRAVQSQSDQLLIKEAIAAIYAAEDPADASFKAQLKTALAAFRAVPKNERRYVRNYATLASMIDMIGGEAALDTDAPYVVSIEVTKQPDKVSYYEGEHFDPAGMIVTARYSDSSTKVLTDYKLSENAGLALSVDTVYVIYGTIKAPVSVSVREKLPWDGEGTENSPYLIKTAEDLNALAQYVNSGKSTTGQYFLVTANIDLSDCEKWTPIGQRGSRQFDGIFDGQGYAIDNLYAVSGGLFGYAGTNAVIRNVGVASGEINAANRTFIGGIVGWSNGADIINCWNGANILCSGYSGGIVGTVRDGGKSTVKGCYNIGTITASDTRVGGIVGHLGSTNSEKTNEVLILDCYNVGTITAADVAGGIVGQMQNGHVIQNCYNVGTISVNGVNILQGAGSIVSATTRNNQIINCYYNSEINSVGISNGTQTATGKTTAGMKEDAFLALLGEGFKKDSYAIVNSGYPLAVWQKTEEADAVDAVIAMIDAIEEVTLERAPEIVAARSAYDGLDSTLKPYVSNLSALEEAEQTLAAMQALEQAKNEALWQLENYKDPSEYRKDQQNELADIISDCCTSISEATDIDAVAAALASAKAKLDSIPTNRELTDREAAKAVSDQIDAIGEIGLDKEAAIRTARAAYDALTDTAKAFVGNIDVLENAEKALAVLKESESKGNDNGSSPTTGDRAAVLPCLLMLISLGGVIITRKNKKTGI